VTKIRLGELSPPLVRRSVKRARIDLEKQLALFDERAFRIVLGEEVAGDLGADGGVHHAVQGSDPLAVDRDILLLDVTTSTSGAVGSAAPAEPRPQPVS